MGTYVRMARPFPRHSEQEARAAIARSNSYAALRSMGTGRWGISTDHFDPYAWQRGRQKARRRPLEDVMVENSTYNRGHLKQRLYDEGLKKRVCELCGHGELWNGRRMSLILDH